MADDTEQLGIFTDGLFDGCEVIDVKYIGFDPKELDIKPMRELPAKQLAQATAIPARLLGKTVEGNSVYTFGENPINTPTYEARFDYERLKGQMKAIYFLMKDASWWTLDELHLQVAGTETGISASLRSFRKKQYGAHTVNRRRRGDPKRGLWEYQLISKC